MVESFIKRENEEFNEMREKCHHHDTPPAQ